MSIVSNPLSDDLMSIPKYLPLLNSNAYIFLNQNFAHNSLMFNEIIYKHLKSEEF